MRKRNWLKYLSILMSAVLFMGMMPSGVALAAEEKILLISFEELELPDTDNFPQGTEEKDLSLPKEIMAWDSENNQVELKDLKWTIRPQLGEEKFDEDTTKEPVKYDPQSTEPGKYVFTLKLADEYEVKDEEILPKVVLMIVPAEVPTDAPTEAPTEAPTDALTEAPTEAPTDALIEAPTEPPTEAPIEAPGENPTEAPTESPTEASTEAPAESPTEAPTETPTETPTEAPAENPTEAPTETPTETPTEAPAENPTEAPTEAPTENPTETPTEAPTETPTEASTEAPAETPAGAPTVAVEPSNDIPANNNGLEGPMVSLVLPRKMEVGKTYQLQYEISDTEAAEVDEDSVSYTVEDGERHVDMPDEDGNFEVLSEGPVAFQVEVKLTNGMELQAYAESSTVPYSGEPDNTANNTSGTEAPVTEAPKWNENMNLAVTGLTAETLAVGSDYPLSYALTYTADGSNVPSETIPEGVSVEYTVSDTNIAEIVKAEDGSSLLRVKTDGAFTVKAAIDGLSSAEISLTAVKSSAADMISFAVGDFVAGPENGVVMITLPCNSEQDLSTITPVIVISEKASVNPASGAVLDFSDGATKTFVVTAEDGVTTNSYQVSVVKAPHSYGEWVTTKAATCTENGEQTRTCGVCGKTETQEIPAKGHTASTEWNTTKVSTCTEKGTQVQYCTVCGEVVNTKSIPALGHSWSTVRTEPTCTENGEEYKKCERCGKISDKKVIEALGHSWSEWTVTLQPTTSSKGKQERKCQREGCDAVETKEIQRLNIIGQASNNTIWGINSSAKYPVNSVITFEAIGDCMDNAEPISGDVRYVPVSTWRLVNDYKWGSNGYRASFRITKAGNYTLEVTFQKQTYDGTQWVSNEGETSKVSRDFVVAGEGQFTDENGNGTGNTNNPDVVIGGGVKTGDNTPIITLVVILVAAAAILIILWIVRKKSRK